jgi:hypothetical protein
MLSGEGENTIGILKTPKQYQNPARNRMDAGVVVVWLCQILVTNSYLMLDRLGNK